MTTRQQKINAAKRQSFVDEIQLVIEDDNTREYMRYKDGRLIDYDLTKMNGKPIRLKQEELEGDGEFVYLPL